MRFVAFSRVACIVGISCGLAPVTSAAQSCKCPKNPGPGGGVQCSKNQIATCDPSSGECNCACDSVQPGKTKAEYEAQIFSKVMHAKVDPADLSSPKYGGLVSSFRESPEDRGTFSFAKEAGAGPSHQVKVAVPEWLGEKLRGGVSIGPGSSATANNNSGSIGGSLSAGPCSSVQVGGENNSASVNCESPRRHLSAEQCDAIIQTLDGKNVALDIGYVVSVPDAFDYSEEFWECFKKAHVRLNPTLPYSDGPAPMTITGGKFDGGISILFHGPENSSPAQWHSIPLDGSPLSLVVQALLNAKLKFQPHSTPHQEEGRITLLIGEQRL